MTNSFGAYVKKARKEKPKINHHDLPLPSQLEQEASIQQELSAQLSSLSTHSMRPVRKTPLGARKEKLQRDIRGFNSRRRQT